MDYVNCTIKTLPPDRVNAAASKAVEINPANRPNAEALRSVDPQFELSRERLSLLTTKYWGGAGVRLTVGFLDNPPADLRRRILLHMNAWGAWSNVQFTETNANPKVRIARTAGDGYWSYLGTDILLAGANEPTMNLDSFTMETPESEFHRVIRHETGHTLGFPHEHRRQAIVDRIDQEKAIAYFMQTQGWSRDEVIAQVLTPFENSALNATAVTDEHSIMCYALPAQIMRDGVAVPGGLDIDNLDAQFAGTLYPGPVSPTSVWPNGKVYLFKGSKYLRYDVATDKTDPGYPIEIAGRWPGFPAHFQTGVDAGVLWTTGKAYYFKGSEYIRYDLPNDRVDPGYPHPIAGNWPGLWPDHIDAAVVWPNGKAYLFKGSQYVRYDIAHDKVDPGYPAPIAGNWPGMPADFASGIDEVVVWNNGKAYFFKGSKYVRYDIQTDRVDPGYPQPIAANWPGVWNDGVGR
jgi:Hemopexin/Astacin (Peptidase family M12A)